MLGLCVSEFPEKWHVHEVLIGWFGDTVERLLNKRWSDNSVAQWKDDWTRDNLIIQWYNKDPHYSDYWKRCFTVVIK